MADNDIRFLRVVQPNGKILLLRLSDAVNSLALREELIKRFVGRETIKEYRWLTEVEGKTEEFRMQMATWPLLEQMWEHSTPYYKRHTN